MSLVMITEQNRGEGWYEKYCLNDLFTHRSEALLLSRRPMRASPEAGPPQGDLTYLGADARSLTRD
jgi:hypothetical protein